MAELLPQGVDLAAQVIERADVVDDHVGALAARRLALDELEPLGRVGGLEDIDVDLANAQGGGLLEATGRVLFRRHLETCVADAMRAGRTEEIVDELMETLKYDKRVLRPVPVDLADPDQETP